jgi:hypothetical protein
MTKAVSDCEIVMVRGVEDANGYPCGGTSVAECCDCGAKLCDLHFAECDLCHETYCSMCFLFHMDQPHAKTNEAVTKDASERRIASSPVALNNM